MVRTIYQQLSPAEVHGQLDRVVEQLREPFAQVADVKGGGKTYHRIVVGQGKCPGKCSAKMSLRYAAMVSDVDGLGAIRCFHPGGPPASR